MYYLPDYDNKQCESSLFTFLLFFMAILLHQSNVIFGVNLSLADFFCLLLLVLLASKKQLYIPVSPIIFLLVIFIFVLIASVFYVPFKFLLFPEPTRILSDFIKLLAVALYFVIGYNISVKNSSEIMLKWYSIFGLCIGILGVVLTLLNLQVFRTMLFFADIRFRGLMIDPNYFAILQITALVYFTRKKNIKLYVRYIAIAIVVMSVIVSGSKTGTITLICYLTFRIIEYILLSQKKAKSIFFQLFFILFILCFLFLASSRMIQSFSNNLLLNVPAFDRIQHLFTDFNGAISENGSGRGDIWNTAFQIIESSPIIGTGIGTYTKIAGETFQHGDVAHNTFLQITAEWGIPLSLVFFSFVGVLLIKSTNIKLRHLEDNLILRDIIIILLIGSMAISLNNARVLWLFLGALIPFLGREAGKHYIHKSLRSEES